jgi:NADH:ubiquinone oxidoreductase subunit B-like Fe-S oxidoreductase
MGVARDSLRLATGGERRSVTGFPGFRDDGAIVTEVASMSQNKSKKTNLSERLKGIWADELHPACCSIEAIATLINIAFDSGRVGESILLGISFILEQTVKKFEKAIEKLQEMEIELDGKEGAA